MCYYVIQGTITKLVSDGAVTIKGCDGFLFKRDSKEYNPLLEKDDIKKKESDGHTEAFSIGNPPIKSKGEYILKDLNTNYPFSALQAGVRIANEKYDYDYMGKSTSFWSSTTKTTQVSNVTIFGNSDSKLLFSSVLPKVMMSVRCVQD